MKITRAGFTVIAVVAVAALFGGAKFAMNNGILGKPTTVVSAIPTTSSISHFVVSDSMVSYPLPVTAAANTVSNCVTMEILAWNAMGGLDLANGGSQTATGSMISKYTNGGCLNIIRQDDYGQMEANMAKFVQSNGANGDAFFAIMGDGFPYVAAALNKLIPGQFAAVGVVGFSDGEDKCMLPANWKDLMVAKTPILISAVPRDGDWNICVKFASDNGIKINVDQKSIDPTAFNFMDVDAFTTADEKLISHACEDRVVVENKIAHGSVKACVNGVATWTPGDVDVVNKFNGSIISVASTHDYAGQMPALIIGAKSWMASHKDFVIGMLKAADRGAMAVRSGQDGLMAMGQVHAQIFKEQDASYWARYFKGEIGRDHAGDSVSLGGSKVINLQEARDYFGLRQGTENIYASVYRVFKAYDESFYPTMYTGNDAIPAYDAVVDTSYLEAALKDVPATQGVVAPSLAIAAPITTTVSKKSWHIEFDSGKATIKAASMDQLYGIEDTAAMTSLRLRLDGYTDATGSADVNTPLSEARAQAVADWLYQKAPNNFPKSRMEARGHGPANPVCGDASPSCYAQNRRVEVTLGQ